ncbi:uncharacterized protein LOC141673705 [Apium graveolens]|uniref:uncharacterized protein LOC141673705 n=1 Tax=Apium graveolens TaxID=4045 RepID=UPI003D78DA3E
MRINRGTNPADKECMKKFTQWVLDIGDNEIERAVDGAFEDDICIPAEFCNVGNENYINDMINNTFPEFAQHFSEPTYLSERAILTPTNSTVAHASLTDIMTFSRFSALSDLNESRYYWTIRVRAQAIWQGINVQTKVFCGLNIIFINDANHKIHAFIAATLCDKFKTDLVKGGIYEISNFYVKVYNGDETYRAIRSAKHMYFNNDTVCTKEVDTGLKIQPLSLDLHCLDDLEILKNDNRFLIDVVGVIDGKPTKFEYKTDGVDRSNVKFTLTDGSSYVNVTFFNEFGDSLLKALEPKLKEHVIIIIASAKISQWNDEVNLTNDPATRFYLNCTHYSVNTIRRSIAESTFYVSTEIEEIEKEVPKVTIKQLLGLKADYIQRTVCVKLSMKKIDKTMSWYCNYCIPCNVDLKLENYRFKCPKCGRMKPYPDRRYEFFMLCSDETGTIPVMWTDDELTRFTGKSVYDIRAVGDGDKFPPILLQFEKKCYTFTVRVSKENVLEGSNVYTAEKVSHPEEISATHDPEGKISLAIKPTDNSQISSKFQ